MALLFALVVMACHKPVFETEVTRVPPASAVGLSCVAACAAVRDPCVRKAKALRHMCESQATTTYVQCLAARGAKSPATRFGPSFNAVGCMKPPCFDSEPRCIAVHDACFVECGGVVRTEERCVKNCGE